MIKRFILASALCLSAVPAQAAITIGSLTQLCGFDASGKEFAPGAHAGCQSYIAGIVDYHELFKTVGKTTANIDFCLPPTLTYTDIQRIVLEYLQSHSQFKESPAASAVVIALHNEFSCGGSGPLLEGKASTPSATSTSAAPVDEGVPDSAPGLQAPDMNDMSGQ